MGTPPSFYRARRGGRYNVGLVPFHLLCTPNREQGHSLHNSIRPLSPVFYLWPEFFTTSAPTKPAHPPECAEKWKTNGEDSGYGFQLSFMQARRPISVPFVALGPEPSTSGPTSPSVRACLFVGSTRPPLSVACRDSSDCMLVVWSLNDHVHASCFVLCVLSRGSTRPFPTLASVFFPYRSRSPAATVLS